MDAFLAVHTHFVKTIDKDKTAIITSPSKAKKIFNRAKSRSPKRKDDPDLKIDSESDNNDEGPTMLEEVDQVVDFNELKVLTSKYSTIFIRIIICYFNGKFVFFN